MIFNLTKKVKADVTMIKFIFFSAHRINCIYNKSFVHFISNVKNKFYRKDKLNNYRTFNSLLHNITFLRFWYFTGFHSVYLIIKIKGFLIKHLLQTLRDINILFIFMFIIIHSRTYLNCNPFFNLKYYVK